MFIKYIHKNCIVYFIYYSYVLNYSFKLINKLNNI